MKVAVSRLGGYRYSKVERAQVLGALRKVEISFFAYLVCNDRYSMLFVTVTDHDSYQTSQTQNN